LNTDAGRAESPPIHARASSFCPMPIAFVGLGEYTSCEFAYVEIENMAKGKRELPFKVMPTNAPGDSLLDEQYNAVIGKLVFSGIVGMCAVWLAAVEWYRWAFKVAPHPLIATVIAAVVAAPCFVMWRRARKRGHDLVAGRLGERYVGAVLDDLRADGFQIVHDVPDKKGNIDHVVIGPGGVFTIETKTRTKRAGDRDKKIVYDGERVLVDGFSPDRDPIAQSQAQARQVREIIKDQTAEDVAVQPVVTYPGWYVEARAESPAVWVHNEKYLVMRLRDLPRVLSAKQVEIYTNALRRYVCGTFGEIELE